MLDTNAVSIPSPPTPAHAVADTYCALRRGLQEDLLELDGVRSALACVVENDLVVVVEGGKRKAVAAVVAGWLPEGAHPFVTHR